MKNKRGTIIDCIASAQTLDSSAEIIDIKGMDISSLGSSDSVFNFEHKGKDNPVQIVGKVTFAKKILKRDDCDNDRQRYYWDKVKKPYIYAKGELFDGVGHAGANDVAAIMRYENKHNGKSAGNVLGVSIEGGTMKREGINIQKSLARDIAITVKPANKVCIAEVIEDSESFSLFKSENLNIYTDDYVEELIKADGDSLYPKPKAPPMSKEQAQAKFGAVKVVDTEPKVGSGKVKVMSGNKEVDSKTIHNKKATAPQWDKMPKSKPESVLPERKLEWHEEMSAKHSGLMPKGHVDRTAMVNHIKEKHFGGNKGEARRLFSRFIGNMDSYSNVGKKLDAKNLKKTMTAGSGMGAPGSLTGGAALSSENIAPVGVQELSKPKKKSSKRKKKMNDMFKSWKSKDKFLDFLSKRLPGLDKKEIESFAKIYHLATVEKQELIMDGLIKEEPVNHKGHTKEKKMNKSESDHKHIDYSKLKSSVHAVKDKHGKITKMVRSIPNAKHNHSIYKEASKKASAAGDHEEAKSHSQKAKELKVHIDISNMDNY